MDVNYGPRKNRLKAQGRFSPLVVETASSGPMIPQMVVVALPGCMSYTCNCVFQHLGSSKWLWSLLRILYPNTQRFSVLNLLDGKCVGLLPVLRLLQ